MILVLLAACKPEATEVEVPTRPEVPPPLEIPDVTGIDFEQSYRDAMALALSVNSRTLFSSHRNAIDSFEVGCPDVYSGIPPEDVAEVEDIQETEEGFTWSDHCAQEHADRTFSGHGYWDSTVQVSGDADGPEGISIDAERRLHGDGVVGDGENVIFEFDGVASDAMTSTEAEGYTRWSYTSLITGTSTGSDPFPDGSLAPFGWRTDLYVSVIAGDDEARIESRGNVYLFDGRLGDRFDSIALDVDIIGELGAGPDDCTQEPLGWIGLRDENAVWYDLVFLPRYSFDITGQPYPNDPLQECDGCGTLYIRGVEQGEVCPDFSGLQAEFPAPDHTDYVFSLRDLPQPPLEAP